ncbi:MAG: ABC transporter ATP-binding protein [Candidatus Diapherotrites archaeon]|nr:ABC transporter ATP-binding protein [Candidatus Diapherotrites archaeon]
MAAEFVVDVKNLSKDFGDVKAVRSISFRVEKGKVFGFLGTNGAGKTTTIKMLCCLLRPTGGDATVLGHNILSGQMEIKRKVGYLPETPILYEKFSLREFLSFIGRLRSMDSGLIEKQSERLAKLFGLEEEIDKQISSYSKGMKQKASLAAALIHDPEVLFLDEPTSGLDARSAKMVKDLLVGLSKKGKTVFMSTHIMEIADELCKEVAIIDKGSIVGIGDLRKMEKGAKARDLEQLFLGLTGGEDEKELAEFLK